MLFDRKKKPKIGERIRAWFWPRKGWRRAWGYVRHRVNRLSGTPHAIALGFSSGVFASFTPFVGFHFFLGFIGAFLIRGSLVASALGTFIGNPFTFPLIWVMTYALGSYLLGLELDHAIAQSLPAVDLTTLWTDSSKFWSRAWPVMKPMIVGGVPLGLLVGAACYMPVKAAVGTYQAKRRARLANNANTGPRARKAEKVSVQRTRGES